MNQHGEVTFYVSYPLPDPYFTTTNNYMEQQAQPLGAFLEKASSLHIFWRSFPTQERSLRWSAGNETSTLNLSNNPILPKKKAPVFLLYTFLKNTNEIQSEKWKGSQCL